jgi:ACS family tartrate transporter-like MFS transporter
MENSFIEADTVLRRAAWRLVPLILAMYVAAFLNRVNVGFAALTMNQDLGFTPEVFGWGTGIFFLGYLLFEVPSNLIMERVGARLWLSRIMITWAIVSMAFAFVQGPVTFFLLRFLAIFCMGIPVSNILGAPLSGWLLGVEGYGFKGWQWMYILEGIPTLALGFLTLWGLPDNPRKASFLSAREKEVVMARLAGEAKPQVHGLGDMVKDWRVWALIIPDFAIVFGIYALGFWMPQMVKAMGYDIKQTSLIVMIPYIASLAILWVIGVSSDRTGKRALHFVISSLVAVVGFAIAAIGGNDALVILGFCLASGGVYSGLATFWSVPPLFLGGTAAAGAFALINSIGNLSGFVGPGLMGWLLQTTGSYRAGLWMCVGVPLVAAISMQLLASSCQPTSQQ